MADLVGSVRTVFAVWLPKFCLTPTGNLLSLKRFLMQVWASLSFDGYAFGRKCIGRFCADSASHVRAEIAAQIMLCWHFEPCSCGP